MVIAMSSIALAAEDPVQPNAPRNNVSLGFASDLKQISQKLSLSHAPSRSMGVSRQEPYP